MPSALILTRPSYPAMPRTRQRVHQRSMHLGPLVAYSSITRGADYIFILSYTLARFVGHSIFVMIGVGVLFRYNHQNLPFRVSRYGVKPKTLNNSSSVFFFRVT